MWKDELKYLGKEIKSLVKDFMNTGDVQKINRDVGSTVSSALDIAFDEVRKAIASIQVETQRNPRQNSSQQQGSRSNYSKGNPNNAQSKPSYASPYQAASKQPAKAALAFPHRPVGKVAGVLLTLFGWIGFGVVGAAAVVYAVLGSILSAVFSLTPVIIGLSAFFAVSVILQLKGSYIRRRLKRYRQYLSHFNGRTTCMIREISSYSGYGERFLIKDFRRMIAAGMFPQAHIDDEKTMIMLNRESYQVYLEKQAEYKARKPEQDPMSAAGTKAKAEKPTATAGTSGSDAIEVGKEYIRSINEARMAITDTEVSGKVLQLEETVSRIIGYVEVHPEKLSEVRRLLAYYLPTTLKLLNAYREFDRQPIQGDNIKKAKGEIKEALDTINQAFATLFDSLFEHAAWDVSTDISVLQTILKQEGLTEKDF